MFMHTSLIFSLILACVELMNGHTTLYKPDEASRNAHTLRINTHVIVLLIQPTIFKATQECRAATVYTCKTSMRRMITPLGNKLLTTTS